MEGPFWKRVRGNGLAYDAGSVGGSVEDGRLVLSIGQATNVVDAYVEMVKVLKEYDSEEVKFDEDQLEAIKSTFLFSHAASISNAESVAGGIICMTLLNLPKDHQFEMMEKIQKTTTDQLHAALRKHFMKLTQHDCTNMIVTCGPAEAPAIIQGFQEKTGRTLKLFTSDNFNDYMKKLGRW
jgi:Zn-dependent M16 (insulinase) family peptidase